MANQTVRKDVTKIHGQLNSRRSFEMQPRIIQNLFNERFQMRFPSESALPMEMLHNQGVSIATHTNPIIFSPRSPLLAPYDIIEMVYQPRALAYKQRFRKRAFECVNAPERKNPPPRSVHAPKLTHRKSIPKHFQKKLWKRWWFTAISAAYIPDPAPRPYVGIPPGSNPSSSLFSTLPSREQPALPGDEGTASHEADAPPSSILQDALTECASLSSRLAHRRAKFEFLNRPRDHLESEAEAAPSRKVNPSQKSKIIRRV